MKKLKGQIGLEYLAIYGIALILLVIVIALVLGMFSNTTASTPICMGEPAIFQCKDNLFQVRKNNTGNNLVVSLRLLNGAPKQIQLMSATCYAGRARPSNVGLANMNNQIVSSQGHRDIEVGCYDANGNAISYTKGVQFDGTVEVIFKYSDDLPNTNRTMYLRIRGVAE